MKTDKLTFNLRFIFFTNHKNKLGFTLFETTFAILIIGVSVTILFGLQSRLLKSVYGAHAIVERVYLAKNFFIQADKTKLYTQAEPTINNISDPETVLTYSAKTSDKKIFMGSENIITEQVTIRWKNFLATREEIFVKLRFFPESKST